MCTPLHLAAEQGKTLLCSRLIQVGGADINAKDAQQHPPLALAATHGCTEVCGELIRLGANVNEPYDQGMTCLHGAAYNGQEVTCMLLVENGADVNALALGDSTPADLAALQAEADLSALAAHLRSGKGVKLLPCTAPFTDDATKTELEAGSRKPVRIWGDTGSGEVERQLDGMQKQWELHVTKWRDRAVVGNMLFKLAVQRPEEPGLGSSTKSPRRSEAVEEETKKTQTGARVGVLDSGCALLVLKFLFPPAPAAYLLSCLSLHAPDLSKIAPSLETHLPLALSSVRVANVCSMMAKQVPQQFKSKLLQFVESMKANGTSEDRCGCEWIHQYCNFMCNRHR